ncbi:MAG TPA: O-antigen ligase family protein [Solirubrobacteraceae bacterium]|nr:O-antigen ligase family protein [Solirubrobacteraceae bacterium]
MTGVALTLATKLPSAGALLLAAVAAAVVIGALAVLMRRYEDALPMLTILALPFRVPISTGGRTVNLLVPLYLVVVAGVLTRLLPALLEARRTGAPRVPWPRRGLAFWGTPAGMTWLLAASVLLYALQSTYSGDAAKGGENLLFFYLPFGLLFVLLSTVRWRRELLLRCLGIVVAEAVLFAGVGFIEYARKSLFLNPKVVAANEFDNYFRVNSVFFDPSVYGRFLALVMIAVCTVVLWTANRRVVVAGACVLAWLLGGLVTSFSQSSIAALLLGLAVLGGWRYGVRVTLLTAVGVLVLAAAALLAAPKSLHFGLKGSTGSTSNATSGRSTLIEGGLELFAKRPLQGYGAGSFESEYRRASETTNQNAVSASHTIPVTISAEQGIVGLAVYVALLVSAFAVLFTGAGRSPPRIAIAACFAALVLHTWTYADFLEDPFTWTLLAVGAALARGGGPRRATVPARPLEAQAVGP